MKLSQVGFLPFDRSLIPEDLKTLPRPTKRLMEVLLKGSSTTSAEALKTWSLDNCLSPRHFLGKEQSPSDVASTEFDVTALSSPFDAQSRVQLTGETVLLPSDIVFRSVGYKSEPLPGFEEIGIQFDERRGTVTNDGLGRVTRLVSKTHAEEPEVQQVPGVYCAGWVKRGPTGVIASTMSDAFVTGDAIAADWLSGLSFISSQVSHDHRGWEGLKLEGGLSNARSVTWEDWRKIDRAERERGKIKGKEREKFTNTNDMLAVLG